MPPSDNTTFEDFSNFADALAHTNAGGTIRFKDGGKIEEPVTLNKDINLDATGAKTGVSFTKAVVVNDAEVSMTNCAIVRDGSLSVTGTKPFTMTGGSFYGKEPMNFNTSGTVTLKSMNIWNTEGTKTYGAIFGDKTQKAVVDSTIFHDKYLEGAVMVSNGAEVAFTGDTYLNTDPDTPPMVISGGVKGPITIDGINVQYAGEPTDKTALVKFKKTKAASEKEFSAVQVTMHDMYATKNANFVQDRVPIVENGTGITKPYTVVGVSGAAISSDNPQITFK